MVRNPSGEGVKHGRKNSSDSKEPAKKKVNNGDSLVCEVCGMSVIVEEIGVSPVAEETHCFAAASPMKAKTSKANQLNEIAYYCRYCLRLYVTDTIVLVSSFCVCLSTLV